MLSAQFFLIIFSVGYGVFEAEKFILIIIAVVFSSEKSTAENDAVKNLRTLCVFAKKVNRFPKTEIASVKIAFFSFNI